MMSDRWVLAIDFGTSFTVAASLHDGGRPEVIEIDGDRRVPSVVMVLEDGSYVIGRAAEESAAARPNQVLRAFKSRIGDPAPIILGGRAVQSGDLVGRVFAKILDEATRLHGSEPESTRLTYPATWSGQRRQQLLRAANIAELPGPVLVPEPIAAAMWYSNIVELPLGSSVLVYDLGGGTFDCALLSSRPTGLELVGRPSGDRQLGGELFDELLANHIGESLPSLAWEQLQLGLDAPWQQAWVALRREARRAKELLSTQPVADILVPLPDGTRPVRVDRGELERLVEPYLVDSVQILVDTVAASGMQPSDLHAVYLVGGASRMPMVEQMIAEAFPDTPISRRADPKTVVALGACLPQRSSIDEQWVNLDDRPTDPAPEPVPARRPATDDLAVRTARDDRLPDAPLNSSPVERPEIATSGPIDEGHRRLHGRWLAILAALVLLIVGAVGAILLTSASDVEPVVGNGPLVFACNRDGDFDLFTVTLSDLERRPVTINEVDDRFPAWNHDGSRLAWSQGPDIVVELADGSAAVNLTATLDDAAEKPAWTPDGATIVFVRKIADTEEIWRMSSTDGSDLRPIITFADHERDAYDPTVESDGMIVYSSRFSDLRVSLYRTDIDGSASQPLGMQTDDSTTDEIAAVSDPSGAITFSRSVDGDRYDVMAGKPGDIDIANLTADFTTDGLTHNWNSTWSPDGRSIVFVNSEAFFGGTLWISDVDSETFTALTDETDRLCRDPDWAPAAPNTD